MLGFTSRKTIFDLAARGLWVFPDGACWVLPDVCDAPAIAIADATHDAGDDNTRRPASPTTPIREPEPKRGEPLGAVRPGGGRRRRRGRGRHNSVYQRRHAA